MAKVNSKPSLKLEIPNEALFQEFGLFIEDMRTNNQTLWDPYLPLIDEAAQDFVHRMLRRETEPEAGLVPETVYWATFDGQVVGRISLRHRLEGNLHRIGGHIGYEVSPRWRRKGFATEMLRQILLTDKAKEIGRLLVTCSPNNEASNKTILSNGGKLTQTIFVDVIQEERRHYWIEAC